MGSKMKYINNCSTGEVIIREMTEDEILAETKQANLYRQKLADELIEAEAKAAQKAALLERLKISEDEARLLLA
jgi:hypothetical protein